MRGIEAKVITQTVRDLFIKANYELPEDAARIIKESRNIENSPLGKSILEKIYENLSAAKELDIPICQDTGMAVLFVEIGVDVHIVGGDFEEAVNEGVRQAYHEGYMRCSIVKEPLFNRTNTGDNTPGVIHTRIVKGDKIKITVAPKGFGSENMSVVRMFNPSVTKKDIIDFVCETVKNADGNPCPPILIGIGIGGTFDYCTLLAKKALTRNISQPNENEDYANLEKEILDKVNKLGIGPQGFGGDVTALGVNIEYYPTHIAGLPVAININCHVMRHAEAEI